jgi:cation diffusion facilitator CzcD-associated flavoprotein CzcO
VRDTARVHGVDRRIRFHHRVTRAEWSSADARWTVTAERTDSGETVELTASFLFLCAGYYRYDRGHMPDFEGLDEFGGDVVHAQFWDEDLDYSGKRVVVVGSGASAVTIVPAMTDRAAHVTMLQRSPSYVVALEGVDPLADLLRRLLPVRAAYALVRWKNVLLQLGFFKLSRRRPELVKRMIRRWLVARLPEDDVDAHFTPRYNPWDQRMCVAPDGDLFEALAAGRASVVTDTIDRFDATGIRLGSGGHLDADLVVAATGLDLLPLGGLELAVDGEEVELPSRVTYKGMMLSGVPNLAFAVGYTNASWTLKCELTCEYVCRLLNHMAAAGLAVCRPDPNPDVADEPLIDFSAGYVLRAIDRFPRQGAKPPWRLHQNYARDLVSLRFGSVEDDAIEFEPAPARAGGEPLPQIG